MVGQEAVAGKSGEQTAIPLLLERLAANDGLKGAIVSIDAIATNATIATAIRQVGADYLLAVKANQPTLRSEIELLFKETPATALDSFVDLDKAHGRIEERAVSVCRETDWLNGQKRCPGELRLPHATTVISVRSRTDLKNGCRFDTRYFISSAKLSAQQAADAVRGHWMIENSLHWVLDVTFKDDLSRIRKGHGTTNMVIVRHFAINLIRAVNDKRTIKRGRKMAAWSSEYLAQIIEKMPR